MNHTIIPLYNGCFSVSYGDQPYIQPFRDIASFCFLVVDEQGHPVLIDTGFSRHYIPGLDSVFRRADDEELDQAIRKAGYSTGDIDTVIQTHLHWDHTGGMTLFPAARFIVQAGELAYLANISPLGMEECAFPSFHWRDLLSRFELVHGSREIVPGISVIWTGDHTPGHQAVKIQTRAGVVILGGDEPFDYGFMLTDVPDAFWQSYKQKAGKNFFWSDGDRPMIRRLLESHPPPPGVVPTRQPAAELKARYGQFFSSHNPKLIMIKSIPAKDGTPS